MSYTTPSTPRPSTRRSTRSQSADAEALRANLNGDDGGGVVPVASTSAAAQPPPPKTPRSRASKASMSSRKSAAVIHEVEEQASPLPVPPPPTFASPSTSPHTPLLDDKSERLAEAVTGTIPEASTSAPNGHAITSLRSPPLQLPADLVAPSPSSLRRLVLRRKVLSLVSRLGRIIRPLLVLCAVLLLLLLPSPNLPFSKKTYVDENALQPGQANVYWGWEQVKHSDELSRQVRDLEYANATERAQYISSTLASFGLQPETQRYTFHFPSNDPYTRVSGVNTYARSMSPRSDGREAFIIAASWLSRWDGTDDPEAEGFQGDYSRAMQNDHRINVRGISLLLALSRYLTTHSHWSKDLIFVFTDGYLDGMQAWSQAYFAGQSQDLSFSEAHEIDPLTCAGSAVWNSVAIDYPSDSFSALEILHDGSNGQLPNMDVLNTVVRIAEKMGRVPVRLPGAGPIQSDFSYRDDQPGGEWRSLGRFLEEKLGWGWRGVANYQRGALNLVEQVRAQTLGRPTGIHGLLQRYHVDAITVYAVPAKGPFGFWHLGRILEASTRSFSNLLERLHHSQFFYLLSTPERFVQIAIYLPVAILLSLAMTFQGISLWLREGSAAQQRKEGFLEVVKEDVAALQEPSVRNSTVGPTDLPLERPTDTDLQMGLSQAVLMSGLEGAAARSRLLALIDEFNAQGRPVVSALLIVVAAHAVGLVALATLRRAAVVIDIDATSRQLDAALLLAAPLRSLERILTTGSLALLLLSGLLASTSSSRTRTVPHSKHRRVLSLAALLQAFTLLEAGMVVAVLSVLNFSLALSMGALLVFPLAVFLRVPETGTSVTPSGGEAEASPSPTAQQPAPHTRITLPWTARTPSAPRCLLALLTSLYFLALLLPHRSEQALALLPLPPHRGLLAAEPTPLASDTGIVAHTVQRLLWDTHILHTWTLPVLCVFFAPVLLLGLAVGMLVALTGLGVGL